jgi:EAL and modified HD-GYP domain-containing signal transduction protein
MEIFVVRQPIFKLNKQVYAYEMLHDEYAQEGGSSDVKAGSLLYTLHTANLDILSNGKPLFIRFSKEMLEDEMISLFSNSKLVVEIQDFTKKEEDILREIKQLREAGCQISINSSSRLDDLENYLKWINYIKIDVSNTSEDAIQVFKDRNKKNNVTMIADQVENHEQYEIAKGFGFDLFQGFFFSKPEKMKSKGLTPLNISYIQLLSRVNDESLNYNELTEIIMRDLSLTYSLLKSVNTLEYGLRREVDSVKDALIILGDRKIRKWLSMILVKQLNHEKPEELVRTSLIRARFSELLTRETDLSNKSEAAFLAGLFSLLDVILDRPMDELLEDIKISSEIKESILTGRSKMGVIIKLVQAYEKADWDSVLRYADVINLRVKSIAESYMEAMSWYLQVI